MATLKFESTFDARVQEYKTQAFAALAQLYGDRDDFDKVKASLLDVVEDAYRHRPDALHALDIERGATSSRLTTAWFLQPDVVGYTCYVDRFGGSLRGIRQKIPYLKSLGITYLHLLSVLKSRPGDNDGGFAVADYQQCNENIGSIDDLESLSSDLQENGISLCIDFVYNHTAREHEWAQKALSGVEAFQDYYLIFKEKETVEHYRPFLKEVFPVAAPGNFSYELSINSWVWTTFYPFQWDLNYKNPKVLEEMLRNLLYLANKGIQIFRMDAAAFTWKRAGTDCLNQPETHSILQALRALVAMAAPSVILKVEAIVGARQATMYFGGDDDTSAEGHIAYHNALMASLWRSLATQDASKTRSLIKALPENPSGTAWVNYLRCHDDIGWTTLLDACPSSDKVATWSSTESELKQLADFYDADLSDNYAKGKNFQTQAGHDVHGTNGTLASLAGLEDALSKGDAKLGQQAVNRILLLYSVLLSQSGIPLINMGDEHGLLNDSSHLRDELTQDGRWLHRPFFNLPETEAHKAYAQKIFDGLQQLIKSRISNLAFHTNADVQYPEYGDDICDPTCVLITVRSYRGDSVLTLANFSEHAQTIAGQRIIDQLGGHKVIDLLTAEALPDAVQIELPPLGYRWLSIVS